MRKNWALKVHGVEERPDRHLLLPSVERTNYGIMPVTSKIASSPLPQHQPPEELLQQNKKVHY